MLPYARRCEFAAISHRALCPRNRWMHAWVAGSAPQHGLRCRSLQSPPDRCPHHTPTSGLACRHSQAPSSSLVRRRQTTCLQCPPQLRRHDRQRRGDARPGAAISDAWANAADYGPRQRQAAAFPARGTVSSRHNHERLPSLMRDAHHLIAGAHVAAHIHLAHVADGVREMHALQC